MDDYADYLLAAKSKLSESSIPVELHGHLLSKAFEEGHSSGYGECLMILGDLIALLEEPLAQYTKRITKGR